MMDENSGSERNSGSENFTPVESREMQHRLKSVAGAGIDLHTSKSLCGVALLGMNLSIVKADGKLIIDTNEGLASLRKPSDFKCFQDQLGKFDTIIDVPLTMVDGLTVSSLVCLENAANLNVEYQLSDIVLQNCDGIAQSIANLGAADRSRVEQDWSHDGKLAVFEDDWDRVAAAAANDIQNSLMACSNIRAHVYFCASRYGQESKYKDNYGLPNVRTENAIAIGILCSYEYMSPNQILIWQVNHIANHLPTFCTYGAQHVAAISGFGEIEITDPSHPDVAWCRYTTGLFDELDDTLGLFSTSDVTKCIASIYGRLLGKISFEDTLEFSEKERAILDGWFLKILGRIRDESPTEAPAMLQLFYLAEPQRSNKPLAFNQYYKKAFQVTSNLIQEGSFVDLQTSLYFIPADTFKARNANIMQPVIATFQSVIDKLKAARNASNFFVLDENILLDTRLLKNIYTANALLCYYITGEASDEFKPMLWRMLHLTEEEMTPAREEISVHWPFHVVEATKDGVTTSPLCNDTVIPIISDTVLGSKNLLIHGILRETFSMRKIPACEKCSTNNAMMEIVQRFCKHLLQWALFVSQTNCGENIFDNNVVEWAIAHWNLTKRRQDVQYWTAGGLHDFLLSTEMMSERNSFSGLSVALQYFKAEAHFDVIETSMSTEIEELIKRTKKPLRIVMENISDEFRILPMRYELYELGKLGQIWRTAFVKDNFSTQVYKPSERIRISKCFSDFDAWLRGQSGKTKFEALDLFACVQSIISDPNGTFDEIDKQLSEMVKNRREQAQASAHASGKSRTKQGVFY